MALHFSADHLSLSAPKLPVPALAAGFYPEHMARKTLRLAVIHKTFIKAIQTIQTIQTIQHIILNL